MNAPQAVEFPRMHSSAETSADTKQKSAVFQSYYFVFAMLASVLPVVPAFAGYAAASKYLSPAVGLIIAALIARKDKQQYVVYCFFLFIVTPLLRRLVDVNAGWDATNPIMLMPYAALAVAVPTGFASAFIANGRYQLAFLCTFFSVAYGFILAVGAGSAVAGAVDAMRWAFPLAMAAYIVVYRAEMDGLYQRLARFFAFILVPLSLYTIVQFVNPPSWDILWMQNVPMNSIGVPAPFEVRAFGTLNSPGSLACVLLVGIVVCLSHWRLRDVISIALAVPALLLTLARSEWGGLAVSVLFLSALVPGRMVVRLLLLGAAFVSVVSMELASSEMTTVIGQRIGTISDLQNDDSAQERAVEYDDFFDELNTMFIGDGFGASGAYRANFGNKPVLYVDSGFIETIMNLGVIGAVVYFAGAMFMVVQALSLAFRNRSAEVCGFAAAVLGIIVETPFGTMHTGEFGMLLWTLTGALLAKRLSLAESEESTNAYTAAPGARASASTGPHVRSPKRGAAL